MLLLELRMQLRKLLNLAHGDVFARVMQRKATAMLGRVSACSNPHAVPLRQAVVASQRRALKFALHLVNLDDLVRNRFRSRLVNHVHHIIVIQLPELAAFSKSKGGGGDSLVFGS